MSNLKHGTFFTVPIFLFVLFFLVNPLFMKALTMKYGFLLSLVFTNYAFMGDYFMKKVLYNEASISIFIKDFIKEHKLLIYGSIGYYLIYTYSKLVRNIGEYSLPDILLPWERPLDETTAFPNDVINSPDVVSATLLASKGCFLDDWFSCGAEGTSAPSGRRSGWLPTPSAATCSANLPGHLPPVAPAAGNRLAQFQVVLSSMVYYFTCLRLGGGLPQ